MHYMRRCLCLVVGLLEAGLVVGVMPGWLTQDQLSFDTEKIKSIGRLGIVCYPTIQHDVPSRTLVSRGLSFLITLARTMNSGPSSLPSRNAIPAKIIHCFETPKGTSAYVYNSTGDSTSDFSGPSNRTGRRCDWLS